MKKSTTIKKQQNTTPHATPLPQKICKKSTSILYNVSTKIVSDFISGFAVCAFVGYYLDEYFGLQPLMIIIFVILGIITGTYNVFKVTILNTQEKDQRGKVETEKKLEDKNFEDKELKKKELNKKECNKLK